MHPILISIGSFHLPTYGLLMVLGILVGIYTAMRLGQRIGLDSALILDYCTWTVLVALVGAKVLMVLTEWSFYRGNPGEIFSFSTFMRHQDRRRWCCPWCPWRISPPVPTHEPLEFI